MFIEVNKNRLNTVSFGKGRRTFLTHGGWVANWEVWQQLFELIRARNPPILTCVMI